MSQSKRQSLHLLRAQLENERSSFTSHWKDLGDYILPRRSRFQTSDVNRGDRRNQKIIDSTATLAVRTLRSGMMSGVTSPARPWFRLTTPDPGVAEYGPVKDWLYTVSQRMATAFLRSNLYNVLPIVYGDIGTFGTAAMIMEEDFEDVLRTYPFAVGSYCLSQNEKLKVDVFSRDFRMTVRQLVTKFGVRDEKTGKPKWENFSEHVRNMWDRGDYEQWIDVVQIIKPNLEFDERKVEAKYKKYESCYFESGSVGGGGSYLKDEDKDRYLRESGYDFFPVLAPRWEVTGEDVYGTDCPGMTALGDIKALQLMHKRKSQAIDKMVHPPMMAPTSLRNQRASIISGDITYVDSRDGTQGFRPVHEVNPRIGELGQDINEHQRRIQKAFFEDLFLMLASSDRRDITAREIDERHEEKLLALGPVLEQLNQDLLDPVIDNTFEIMLRQNFIPPPPQEIQGMKLKVEYISIMAQAQKLVGIAGVERFMGFAGQVAGFNPEALDKIDLDQTLDVYADMTSIPPGIVRPDEKVEEIRSGRQQAAAAQNKMAMLQQGADTAKTLSETNTNGDSALKSLIDQSQAGQLVET